jgi:hypothetical protein
MISPASNPGDVALLIRYAGIPSIYMIKRF